jgi:hypothetical protein
MSNPTPEERTRDLGASIRLGYHSEIADQIRAAEQATAEPLVTACRLMFKAWDQLLPCLKNGVVQDYQLVLTDAPLAVRKALEPYGGVEE